MALLIGMDEAGLGPNLGPLVVSLTSWSASSTSIDLWNELNDVVSRAPVNAPRLQFGDSKEVYSPQRGLAPLERSVLSLLSLNQPMPTTIAELWRSVGGAPCVGSAIEPWFDAAALTTPLPLAASRAEVAECAEQLRELLSRRKIALVDVKSDVVLTDRFNRLTRAADSKGTVLTETTLSLLRMSWDVREHPQAVVYADRHGGRRRYHTALCAAFDNMLVMTLGESPKVSRYQVYEAEVRFEVSGERHFPVAAASMVSKYLRETAMELFNAYWLRHLPDLAPTKGYPQDARRFRDDIREMQHALGIDDDLLWRHR